MAHRYLKPPKITGFRAGTTLDEMLMVKTFEQLRKDGDVLDVKGAADKTGYDPKHLQRLCREKMIDHVTRGMPIRPKEVQFFFLAWQLKGLFQYKKATA